MNSHHLLSATQLEYSFLQDDGNDRIRVLKNVSLNLEAGKVTAVVGPSGCGKSTLLYLLGLLDRPDDGSILIKGIDTTAETDEVRTRLRNQEIGFVFQFHFLIQELTVLENVSLPMQKAGMEKNQAQENAQQILTTLGIGDKLSRNPQKLSGGERQRVAIARALSNQPSILLADEPTGNLDTQNSDIVFDAMMQLAQDKNIGVCFVTHNRELAERCDQIISLCDGELVVQT